MKIERQYVSIELAKLLKEKGFDEYGNKYVDKNGVEHISHGYNSMYDRTFIPEMWIVVEWLRTNHGIWIEVLLEENAPYNRFYYRTMKVGAYFTLSHDGFYFDSPSEAYLAAINYTLKDLI